MNGDFELAVSAMLARQARVDPATLAGAREFIATLPDRRSRAARPMGRLMVGLPRLGRLGPLGPALPVAAVVALVLGLAGVSVLGRLPGEAALSAAPTAVARTPRPSPAYVQTAPVVLTGLDMTMFGWSPDGSHFAIGEFSDPYAFHLLDRAGDGVATVAGRDFAWLSADQFVILRRGEPWNDGSSGDAYLGRLGTTELTPIAGDYLRIVSGASGAVALNLDWTDPWLARYVVWSESGFTQPRAGSAERWSRDGRALAVMHIAQSDTSIGSLEVASPTGQTLASVTGQGSWGNFLFSPDDAYLEYADTSYATGVQPRLLDLRTGRSTTAPDDNISPSTFAWVDGRNLLVENSQHPGAFSWSAVTDEVTLFSPNALRGASGQGVVATSPTDQNARTRLTFSTGGASPKTVATVALGAPLAWSDMISEWDWSPDGRSVVLVSGAVAPGASSPMDVLLVSW